MVSREGGGGGKGVGLWELEIGRFLSQGLGRQWGRNFRGVVHPLGGGSVHSS